MDHLQLVHPYWQSAVGVASQYFQRSEAETELVLATACITLTTMLVLSLVSRLLTRSWKEKPACCVTEFMQQRKAKMVGVPSIPSGSGAGPDPAFMTEVHHQLSLIHKEILNLKHERELVDNELIETSTQILQTIGASFGAGDEMGISRDDFSPETIPNMELPAVVHKPIPHRPAVQPASHQQPLHVVQPVHPVDPTRVAPLSRGIHDGSPNSTRSLGTSGPRPRSPQSATSMNGLHPPAHEVARPAVVQPSAHAVNPIRAPHQLSPQASSFAQVPAAPQMIQSQPAPIPHSAPPKAAAPKMSAIAAARIKREAEQAENTPAGPAAPVGSTNPFGKARSAPFGASPS